MAACQMPIVTVPNHQLVSEFGEMEADDGGDVSLTVIHSKGDLNSRTKKSLAANPL